MPIRIRVNTKLGLMAADFEGVVTAEEFERHAGPVLVKPEYVKLPLTLVDLTAALRFDGPSEVAVEHARRAQQNVDGKIEPGARVAFAATSGEWFGLARMYQMLREGAPVEVKVFRSLGEAEKWLDLPEDYADQLVDVE